MDIKQEEVFGLFPTPLFSVKSDIKLSDYDIEIIKKDMFLKENEGNITYLNNDKGEGYSNVLEKEELNIVRNFIIDKLKFYKEEVWAYEDNISVDIVCSWMNEINTKDQFHHAHIHPNSIFSGVFYIRCLEEDKIYFGNDNQYGLHRKTFSVDNKNFNVFNSESWWWPVEEGQLIIFPSYLRHWVPQNLENNYDNFYRLSLSFNAFYKNCELSKNSTTYLKV